MDQHEDFFDIIEEGDDAIREYFELFEYEIFNNDPADLEQLIANMGKDM